MTLNETYLSFFDWLEFESPNHDILIVTPNQRLSRFVLTQWSMYQQTKGKKSWAQLPCLPIDTWVKNLWEMLQYASDEDSSTQLLTHSQVQALWLDIVNDDKSEFELSDTSTLMQKAIQAKNILSQWQVKGQSDLFSSDTYTILKRWMSRYKAMCDDRGFIDDDDVRKSICHFIESHTIKLPTKCVFLDFDTLTPWHKHFISSLEKKGVQIFKKRLGKDIPISENMIERVALQNEEEEIHYAARWALQSLHQYPELSIGIVVPNLSQEKAWIERIISSVLDPNYVCLDIPRRPHSFTLSAAEPLNRVPLIKCAFDILHLNYESVSVNALQDVICSPFVACSEEEPQRYRMLKKLAESYIDCTLKNVSTLTKIESKLHPACTLLAMQLDAFTGLRKEYATKSLSFSVWKQVFTQQLAVFEWGRGGREVDSLEYQQWMQWHDVLDQFAHLDLLGEKHDLAGALEVLTVLTQQPFHAQTKDSPVQVLGLFEAAGLKFDRLWVCGMQQTRWPPSPDPNPFLPFDMQRTLDMPRSSAEKELQLARRLTEQFAYSASQVYFSFHMKEGDMQCEASALILDYPSRDASSLLGLSPIADPSSQNPPKGLLCLEQIEDVRLDPLSETQRVRGGASVLRHQADCPFKAAAKHRLFAWGVDLYQPGVTPRLRGELMHLCLDVFWQKIQDQKTLLALGPQVLSDILDDIVERSWRELTQHVKINLYFKRIELERTKAVLECWLSVEKQRANFVVANREYALDAKIGPLTLTMRVDRIDQVNNTHIVVIDYKTGRSRVKDWLSNLPKDPQLPAYALALPEEVDGIAYGELRLTDVQLKGMGSDALMETGLNHKERLSDSDLPVKNWPILKQHWQKVLTKLATDFCLGEAQVSPNVDSGACDYCDLASLCRVAHQ